MTSFPLSREGRFLNGQAARSTGIRWYGTCSNPLINRERNYSAIRHSVIARSVFSATKQSQRSRAEIASLPVVARNDSLNSYPGATD